MIRFLTVDFDGTDEQARNLTIALSIRLRKFEQENKITYPGAVCIVPKGKVV